MRLACGFLPRPLVGVAVHLIRRRVAANAGSSRRKRTRLYAAHAKVRSQSTSAVPRCRSLRSPATVLSRGSDGGDRDRRFARVRCPGSAPHPSQGPRHDATLRLVCRSPSGNSGEGSARCRWGAAGDRSRTTLGAERGHATIGSPAAKVLRGRSARASQLQCHDAGRRVRHDILSVG